MSVNLYNFTLQKPGTITHSLAGIFSEPGTPEIIVARGHILELLRPDDSNKLQAIVSTEVFGCIRSMSTFKLHGA